MAWPTHGVYMALTTKPRVAPVWVDVSAYVEKVSWRSPTRRSDKDRFDAATITVTFKNEDRRFDPAYTSGAYYPNMKLMRRLKWEVTYGATTTKMFEGYIDRIPQEYEPPRMARATVHATDGLGVVLSKAKLPSSVYEFQIDSESPAIWWRMNEGAGSTVLADSGASGGTISATITGTAPAFGASSLIYGDPNTGIQWVSGGVAVAQPNPPEFPLPSAFPFTIEGWFQTTTVGSADKDIINIWGIGSQLLRIRIGGTAVGAPWIGKMVISLGEFVGGTTLIRRVESTILVDDNLPHHFAAVFTNSTDYKIYIDGVDRSGSVSGSGTPSMFQWRQISIGNAAPGSADATFGGVLDEFAVYLFAQPPATPLSHYTLGTNPWAGDTTGARLGRLLDIIGWPAGDRNIDTGNSTVQAATISGQSVLDHAQLLEKSERGLMFMEAGAVRFIARHNRYKAPYNAVQATFGDSVGELEYTDLAYDYAYPRIINEARLTREGGATQVASDAVSDDEYYTSTFEDSGFLNQTDAEMLDMARFIVARSKDPILEVQSLRVEPTDKNGLFTSLLPLKVADRIRIKRIPQDITPAIDQECHIEGIEVEAGNLFWTQQMAVSPADTTAYWLVGVAGFGEVGTTARVGF